MDKIQRLIAGALLSAMLVSGCASVDRVSPSPSPSDIPAISTATPRINIASLTPVVKTPSIVPNQGTEILASEWNSHFDPQFRVTLNYPAYWQKDDPRFAIYSSKDGFFQLSAVGSEAPTAREICANELDANARKQPRFGTTPKLEYLKIDGQAACLILPSDDQAEIQRGLSLLAVQYPDSFASEPNILLLFADKNHIRQIGQTIRFGP